MTYELITTREVDPRALFTAALQLAGYSYKIDIVK